MRKAVFFLFILSFMHRAFGQFSDVNIGARQSGIGGAAVTIEDGWGIVNNVGSLGRYRSTAASVSYISRYGISEISSAAFGATHYLKNIGTFGLVASRFGDVLTEQYVGLGFSNKFGLVSLGASMNYFQLRLEGFGKASTAVLNFGGVAEVIPELVFGAHVFNINQGQLNSQESVSIPVIMKTGLSYRPNEEVMFNTEVEKALESQVNYKFGLEYFVQKMLILRTGFHTEPFVASGGIGVVYSKLHFDYSYGNRDLLGSIHEITVGYKAIP